MKNQVFLDPSIKTEKSWRVCFNESIVKADFNSKGAAQAHLELLEKGYYEKKSLDKTSPT